MVSFQFVIKHLEFISGEMIDSLVIENRILFENIISWIVKFRGNVRSIK